MAGWTAPTPASCGTPTRRPGRSCRAPGSTSTGIWSTPRRSSPCSRRSAACAASTWAAARGTTPACWPAGAPASWRSISPSSSSRRPPRRTGTGFASFSATAPRCRCARGCLDAVTAFMSLMDVADPERTLREVSRVLRPGGFVQFSVVHPATSTPVRRWVERRVREPSGAGHRRLLLPGPGHRDLELRCRAVRAAGPAPAVHDHLRAADAGRLADCGPGRRPDHRSDRGAARGRGHRQGPPAGRRHPDRPVLPHRPGPQARRLTPAPRGRRSPRATPSCQSMCHRMRCNPCNGTSTALSPGAGAGPVGGRAVSGGRRAGRRRAAGR